MSGKPTDPPADFTPSDEWIEAFTIQCTDQLRVYAKAFAARRIHGLVKTRGHVDDFDARELVQDILGDTLLGIRVWDPAAKTLQQHVEDAIASRAKHLRDRAKKFRHQRVDAFDPDGENTEARGDLEAALHHEHEDDVMSLLHAREVIAELRALAPDDAQVLRCLDAIEAGARTRDDIMFALNVSAKTFRNIRGRLRRFADKLDPQTIARLRQA